VLRKKNTANDENSASPFLRKTKPFLPDRRLDLVQPLENKTAKNLFWVNESSKGVLLVKQTSCRNVWMRKLDFS